MHPRYLLPLLVCLHVPLAAHGEDATAMTPTETTASADEDTAQRLQEQQRRLADTEQQRAALDDLRQENRRLKQQLSDAQAQRSPRLLTEEQSWFATGAATALIAFVLGALSRGIRRRQRREWIN
ncbi:hypothetical protein [Pseudomonas panipatensis]|jgi:hypothetical protein|uniref:Translation initiation factor 2 (IF-2, GTPase) n=1 Tax=Pseudomonas panipatensis TaxID=428992 RepID=A0A1G8C4E9_9PSED|nr:hypothetical protein [Pseudomonas panipatensis]SDH40234.1 hypothetical protein SAMN05216272_101384 [Pseudomonas panipatensis]SMP66298.1 hypothetical protein SAMN06295951_107132 [Pseudomonas panipatensis]